MRDASASLPPSHCVLCGGGARLWRRRGDRALMRCGACRFMWVPQGVARGPGGKSIYEDEARALFSDFADYYADDTAVAAARDKAAWVAQVAPPGAALLDVGANAGHFLREARRRFEAIGIEVSGAAVRDGQRDLGDAIRLGSIEDDVAEFHGRFDVVTMFDVIEHLADPRGAVLRCRDYLAPGGRLFITTPDSDSLTARLLGRRWYHLDMEQHISVFGRDSLDRLLAASGFDVESHRTIGRDYRLSYIERRLRDLGRDHGVGAAAAVAVSPLRLAPRLRIAINLGDVVGVVARRA